MIGEFDPSTHEHAILIWVFFCGIIVIKLLSSGRLPDPISVFLKGKIKSFWCAEVCGLSAELECMALCKEGKPKIGKTEPFLVSALAIPQRSSNHPLSSFESLFQSLLACFSFPAVPGG